MQLYCIFWLFRLSWSLIVRWAVHDEIFAFKKKYEFMIIIIIIVLN